MVSIAGPTLKEIEHRGDEAEAEAVRVLRLTLRQVAAGLPEHPTVDDLAAIQPTWLRYVDEVLLPLVGTAYHHSAESVRENIGTALNDVLTASLGDDFDIPKVTNEMSDKFMENARNRLVNVGDEIWETTRSQLVEGMKAGEGIDELRDRIHGATGLSQGRCGVIARTEVNGAMNAGSIDEMRAFGMPAVKIWLSTPGPRTRATHVAANGTKAKLDGKFMVGGRWLDRPHDPNGPAKETINCRCTMTYDVQEPVIKTQAPQVEKPPARAANPAKATQSWRKIKKPTTFDRRGFKKGRFTVALDEGVPDLTPALQARILNCLDDLEARFPQAKGSLIFNIKTDMNFNAVPGMGRSDLAFAICGRGSITVRYSSMLNTLEEDITNKHLMPSSHDVSAWQYTITHEWGHTIDTKTPAERAALVKRLGAPGSNYSKTNDAEAVAEAFAEWANTHGKTTNRIVQEYAKAYKWEAV